MVALLSNIAFVFDVKGLIADISNRGAKFNKLECNISPLKS
jgi:hypothetical protein